MHDHREILALAAAAIDFELDPVERSQLEAALETCSLCRRQVSAMGATATVLRRPSDIGTPSRVRDVVIGAAFRGGRRTPSLRTLLAASLSLLVVLGGTAVIVGNRGSVILPSASPPASAPVETAAAQASPSPTATPMPAETQPSAPTETSTPSVSQAPVDNAALAPGEIAAMVTDGRLVIRTRPGTGTDSAVYKTKIYPGQRLLISEGPVVASGYPWFRVRLGAIEGWVAAAGQDGMAWLGPVRNGLIAFVRDAADGSGEAIYTVSPDGTAGEAVLLADPGLVHYDQLAWSPDGRRLAFVGKPTNSLNGSSEIFVVDADGSNLEQLTQNEFNDESPTWSPDSTQVAFRRANLDPAAADGSNVVVLRADGSAIKVLGPGTNPVWSPDGQQLAMTVSDGGSSHIWVQAADGADRRQVTDVSVASAPPAWSPDGQYLVVSSSGLSVVEVSSGLTTRLTAEPGSMPTWSVGGTIAFSTTGSASPGIFVVRSDGSGLRRVSGDLSGAILPRWSPDGLRLVLTMEANGSRISVIDPDGGGLTFVDGQVYVVASGDTLANIARAHGLSVDALMAANPQISAPDRIAIGDVIVIPTTDGTDRSPAWQPVLP